jgi:pimeloyl-ACP methyl ester carboxylesterase
MKAFRNWSAVLFFVLLVAAGSARADVLLLVHGFEGNILSWERSGVNSVLQQFGWKRAGVLVGAPQGLIPIPSRWQDADNKVISLQLNSEISLQRQANVFTAALRWVNDRYPAEKIVIAGHSLGGVVARLSMVRDGAPHVKALITIASPHLGTALAYRGLDEINDPFPINKIKEYFGGKEYQILNRSRTLLHEIVPAIPGKLLYWLNSRKHPDIKYYSVVRSTMNGILGDPIVPGFSQDMANVPAIGKQSTRIIEGFVHNLTVLDGYTLVNILEQLKD